MKTKIIILLCFTAFLTSHGCIIQSVEVREPLPDIIWPKPPETPRILLLNSFSKPEHLNLKDSALKRIFSFLDEKRERAIVKPYGIEVDSAGRYFVVDTHSKSIHVFDRANGNYYTFPGDETSFESPIDVALGKDGRVYVSDSKEAVIKVFENYGKTFVGDTGKGFLGRPTGIDINETTNELLVVDTLNSQIIRYDINTMEFRGTIGRSGSEEGEFHFPTNIFVTKDGHIYVSDSLNFRVQIFSPDGIFLHAFGKVGNSPGFFSRPRGIAVDSDGNIYVVDALFDNVQVFNKQGNLLMDFGGPGYGYGEFWLPSGIFIDDRDRIFVSDTYNKRIQVFQYLKDGEF
ncbi:MAG: 6-bladed beta-propeller [Nitrospirota bacterium]